MTPRFAHFAVIGVLSAAFTLAGCGRKGPLDAAPGAEAPQPARTAGQGSGLNPMARETPSGPAAFDSEGKPVAAKGVKRHLPIDWLIE